MGTRRAWSRNRRRPGRDRPGPAGGPRTGHGRSGAGGLGPATMAAVVEAVVFDMDGVLVDSETLWDAAREQVTLEHGGSWGERAQRDMMGMSSREWSRYM